MEELLACRALIRRLSVWAGFEADAALGCMRVGWNTGRTGYTGHSFVRTKAREKLSILTSTRIQIYCQQRVCRRLPAQQRFYFERDTTCFSIGICSIEFIQEHLDQSVSVKTCEELFLTKMHTTLYNGLLGGSKWQSTHLAQPCLPFGRTVG